MVRAKYRVMSVTKRWDGRALAELYACTANDIQYEADPIDPKKHRKTVRKNPENAAFWSATPSGEARWVVDETNAEILKEGQYVYIDIAPASAAVPEAPLFEGEIAFGSWHSLQFKAHNHTCDVKMTIEREAGNAAIRQIVGWFLPQVDAWLGGDRDFFWRKLRVTISPAAEAQPEPCTD
jgi:hypothetical protein